MAETSSSSQWDLMASFSCLAKALHKVVPEPTNIKISSAPTGEPLGERAIFPVVVFVIIMIANGNPSPALAEAEETAGTGNSVSDYNQSSFSFDLADYSTGGNFSREFDLNPAPNAVLGSSVNLGDVFIPATVWSLNSSTGDHLDRIPGEVDTDLEGALGNHRISTDFWTQTIGRFWAVKDSYRAFDGTSFSALRVQLASCGGNSAERRNLVFCNINPDSMQQDNAETTEGNTASTGIASDNNSSTAIGSNIPSASSLEPQPVVGPGLPSLVPAAQFPGRHSRHVVSTAPVDDAIAPVDDAIAPADDPIAPADDPIPPIVDEAYVPPSSDPVVSIGDTWPVLEPPPIFTPPPESPIPETSTWIMMMLGFGMMFLVMHRNSLNSIKKYLLKIII